MQQPDDAMMSIENIHNQLWGDIRHHRNQQLNKADIQINKLEDAGEDASDWRTYRQLLRDLPSSTDNPTQVVWPKIPE